jgi:hypothetical protein
MRRAMLLVGVVFCCGAWCARPALAQRLGSRSMSLPSLVGYDAVLRELAVDEETAGRLRGLAEEYRAAVSREMTALNIDYAAISDLPALERAAEMRKVNAQTAEVLRRASEPFLPRLKVLLSPAQMERLTQIYVQAAGIDAWTEPPLAAQLELTAEQQHQLAALRDEYLRRQQSLPGDFQQRFAQIRELNSERDARALTLLTPSQQEKLRALQGAPFDVRQLTFGRGRRGN